MVKINLLPYREEKEKANAKRQIVVALTCSGIFFFFIISIHIYISMGMGRLETEVASSRARLTELTSITGNLDEFKLDKERLERKIGIIESLEKGRDYSVHIVDEIASRISPKKEWLTSLNKSEGGLRIEGIALDNPAIAKLMQDLEASPYIGTVDLIASKQITISGVKVKAFNMLCSMEEP